MTATNAAFIHPKAHVDSASLGAGSKVWQFASVIRGAFVGAECIVGAGAVLDGCIVGDRCRIQSAAFIPHGVRIGDDVFVGPGAIFCNDMWPDATHEGIDHAAVAAGCAVLVGHSVSIGARAVILPGVTIGAGAFVAAGAVVDRDVPAGMLRHRNGYTGPLPSGRRRMRLIC